VIGEYTLKYNYFRKGINLIMNKKSKEYYVDRSGVVHFIKEGEKYKVTE